MKSKKQLKIESARKLRKEQTKTEKALWWILRDRNILGYKFRRQYLLDGFILDFYCPMARLGIELDGKVHLKQKDYDYARQRIIEDHGIKMLRFANQQIFNQPERVLKTITQNLPLGPLLEKERGNPDEIGVGEVVNQ